MITPRLSNEGQNTFLRDSRKEKIDGGGLERVSLLAQNRVKVFNEERRVGGRFYLEAR